MKRKHKKGMSLVEVLASIVIISVVMTSITTILLSSYLTSQRSYEKLSADYALQTYVMMLKEDFIYLDSVKTYLSDLTDTWANGDDFSTQPQPERLYLSVEGLGHNNAENLCRLVLNDNESTSSYPLQIASITNALYDTEIVQIDETIYNNVIITMEIVNVRRITSTSWNVEISIIIEFHEDNTIGEEDINVIYIG